MRGTAQPSRAEAMIGSEISAEGPVLDSAARLAQSIQSSAEWQELVQARGAAAEDERFTRMVARRGELAGLQGNARERGELFDNKLLVELMALEAEIRSHELYIRQQEAWRAVTGLLQGVNERISQELGLDFASSAASRVGGCCG
jgi:cell fate (sporulation/competence/biofilm development) regulator YlbF (YheA/YmcA/DUF963 family)